MNFTFNSNMIGSRKTHRKKVGIGTLALFLIIGIAFTVAGIALVNSSKINPDWKRVNGTVVGSTTSFSNGGTSNSTTYTPIIQYTVSGQAYHIAGSTGSSSYPVKGTPKQVAYDPSSPGHAKQVVSGGARAFFYVFPLAGILVIIGSILGFIRSSRRSHDIGDLMSTGQKIQGVIVDIQSTMMNTTTNTGGFGNATSASYKVVVAATDANGQVHNYTSDSLQGIEGLAMADFRANPIPVDVYVDPANPNNYYVDVSELPNLSPDRIAGLIKSAAGATQYHSIVPGQAPSPATNSAPAPFSPLPPAPSSPQPPAQPPAQPAPPAPLPTQNPNQPPQ
jgi:hypothetical protein